MDTQNTCSFMSQPQFHFRKVTDLPSVVSPTQVEIKTAPDTATAAFIHIAMPNNIVSPANKTSTLAQSTVPIAEVLRAPQLSALGNC